MSSHYPSSGKPYAPSGDLGGLSVSGNPENLNREGAGVPEAEAEVNEALAEFAPIKKASRSSSLKAGPQKISIAVEGYQSAENQSQPLGRAKGPDTSRDE